VFEGGALDFGLDYDVFVDRIYRLIRKITETCPCFKPFRKLKLFSFCEEFNQCLTRKKG
jgi:hypothetical protein